MYFSTAVLATGLLSITSVAAVKTIVVTSTTTFCPCVDASSIFESATQPTHTGSSGPVSAPSVTSQPIHTAGSGPVSAPLPASSAAGGETCIAPIGAYCDAMTPGQSCCTPNSCFFNKCITPGGGDGSSDPPTPSVTPVAPAPSPPAGGETCIAALGAACDAMTPGQSCCTPNSCFFGACTGP